VRRFVKKNPKEMYSTETFKMIKKELKGRQFLVRDDEDSPWREASNTELISCMGECWREQKKQWNKLRSLSPRGV
jgi:hypothetical protein